MSEIILRSQSTYNYYLNFLDCLSDIAHPEYPGKFWVDEDGYECYAEYSEMYNCFMDSCEYILEWKPLSTKQRQKLQKLCEMLEDYEEYLPDRKKTDDEIRADPKWDKIRKFAQTLYEELRHVRLISE